jgi:hypothetical protein
MDSSELNDTAREFMIRVFEQIHGDQSAQISMYDVGASLGLDRDAAAKVAEELMGLQLVEIRTLSGGIGISTTGCEMMQDQLGPTDMPGGPAPKLGDERHLTPAGLEAVKEIVSDIKRDTGSLGLDFGSLTELMADMKTIDAQLESSKPKTAIVRECFVSINGVLKSKPKSTLTGRINGLLGK